MSFARRVVVAIAILVIVLAVSNERAVAQGNAPSTQPITGVFTAAPADVKERTCEGADGSYVEFRGLFTGVITSSDPRLTGDLEFRAEPALINFSTGFGTFQGRFRVTDPTTGLQTAEGQFRTVVTETSVNHGFAVGDLMNQGTGAASSFFANLTSRFDSFLNLRGQFGGEDDSRTPAVIQGGHCTGRFGRVP